MANTPQARPPHAYVPDCDCLRCTKIGEGCTPEDVDAYLAGKSSVLTKPKSKRHRRVLKTAEAAPVLPPPENVLVVDFLARRRVS